MKEGYKKTELGWIPDTWKIKKLKDIVDICYGKSQKEVECEDGKYKILGTGGVIGFTNSFLWDKPSVLIGRKGTIDRPQYIEEPFWTVDTLFYTKLKKNNMAKWLYYYVNNIDLKKYNEATGVPSLSVGNLNLINIVVPPLKEQEKIADILSTVDSQIDYTDKLIEKTKELKKGLMQRLLTKGIGHTEFKKTEVGDIPVEWHVCKLKDITERMIVGLATSVTQYYRENGVPIIRNKNIKYCQFDGSDMLYLDKKFAESQSNKTVNTDDVITVHTGSNIGLTCLVPNEYEGSHTFTTLITTVDKNIINPLYLMYHINSQEGIKEIDMLQVGGGKNNLNVKEFELYRIAVPNTISEQKKIAEILTSVDAKIEEYKNKKSKLEELKRGLMQQLLTGKIRVI